MNGISLMSQHCNAKGIQNSFTFSKKNFTFNHFLFSYTPFVYNYLQNNYKKNIFFERKNHFIDLNLK